jgi:hypothetical protein
MHEGDRKTGTLTLEMIRNWIALIGLFAVPFSVVLAACYFCRRAELPADVVSRVLLRAWAEDGVPGDVALRISNLSASQLLRLPANGERLVYLVDQGGKIAEFVPLVDGCAFHNDVLVVAPGEALDVVVAPPVAPGVSYRIGVKPHENGDGPSGVVWSGWLK